MLVGEVFSIILFAYIVGLTFLSNYFLHRIDTKALRISQEANYPDSFIAERAYQHLDILDSLGPKVVGSKANEEFAATFIFDVVNDIQQNATNPNDIIIDRQISSGYNYVNYNYANLQNIVVRVQGETNNALMLNCHFDSVPGSPGASDDIVNCCVMIEILRVLTRSHRRQKHTIIFLFNGSEESGLQAAHGFITQQKWRKEVKAYINLESTGSGGREILFRTGPKHDWLVRMYRESAPRPFGQVLAEELFETGVIPSATDFEIFRKYGEIPGLDFAYVENGWRYHTRYDSVEYITMDSVQHTGNNILALARKIANSDELNHPPEGTSAVYFDYLGLFLISYTGCSGAIFNYIIAVVAFVIPFLFQTKFKLGNVAFVVSEILVSLLMIIASLLLSALACYGMASIMNSIDNAMFWYNTTTLSIGIYGSLALLVQIATYHVMQVLFGFCQKTKKHQESSKRHRVKMNLTGVTLFWSILTITFTVMGFRSTYVLMILLFVSLWTYLLTFLVGKLCSKTWSHTWILTHVLGHSVVFLFLCYMCLQIHQLFIPLSAKIYVDNPEVDIALICFLWVSLCLSYFVPLTLLVRFRFSLYSALTLIFGVSIILSFTSIGFPYSDNKSAPRLQRFEIAHTKRTQYDSNGRIEWFFNDVVIYPTDRNGIKTTRKAFGKYKLEEAAYHKFCGEQLFSCGYLAYKLNERILTIGNIDAPPNIAPTKFKLLKATRRSNIVEIEFSLDLKTSMQFSLTLDDGLTAVWSNVGYQSIGQYNKIHLVGLVTFGRYFGEPYVMKFRLMGVPKSDILARLTIITIDSTFDQGEITPEFDYILTELPDYTFSYVHQVDSSTYEIREQ